MHYTFIPSSEKQDLRQEYRIRAVIVLLFFVSVSIIVGIAALFPAYIVASIDQASHIRDVAVLKAKPDALILANTKKDLSASTALVSVLKDYTSDNDYSRFITNLVLVRGNVRISSLVLDESSSAVTIVIQGIAPTRDSLLSFKKRLLTLATGTTVDLPISQLAKDADLPFSIKVTQPLK